MLGSPVLRRQRWVGWVLWAALLLLSVAPTPPARGQEAPAGKNGSDPLELRRSIETTIASESASLKDLRKRLEQVDAIRNAVSAEINAYSVQDSLHTSLVLLATTTIEDLRRAIGEGVQAIRAMEERARNLGRQRDAVAALQAQAREQIGLAERQLDEIKQGDWGKEDRKALLAGIGELEKILQQKEKALQTLHGTLQSLTANLEEAAGSTRGVVGRLESQVKSREKQTLLEKRALPLKNFDPGQIGSELEDAARGLGRWFTVDFPADGRSAVRKTGTATTSLTTFVVLMFVAFMLLRRFRRFLLKWEASPRVEASSWRGICLVLIRRSVLPLGTAAALWGYGAIQFPHYRHPAFDLVLHLLLIWAATRWVLDLLRIREPPRERWLLRAAGPRVRSLTRGLRVAASGYVVMLSTAGADSLVLFLVRLALELALVVWCYSIWRDLRRAGEQAAEEGAKPPGPLPGALMLLSYLIALGGPFVEFSGFPALAAYWYVSWAKTAAVVFWLTLSFLAIREWHGDYRKAATADSAAPVAGGHPVSLFFIQAAWLLWALSLVDGLVLAWSTNFEVIRGLYAFMAQPWTVGKISLSLLGVIYALVILFFTYTLTRVGRYVLAEKILDENRLEPGLKASILSIFVYLMWGLGLVLALAVLGVSATSLAVVFGALSIGIGFGLQNIFNNFISGVILLFERPIQVGDAVEVGGIWGEVRKINVRATIVQTFDNASLIIPNSEFISSQVTNWSFKDQRLRRKVEIGVAYGSDVERVRRILLEIADRTPNVLKYPKPDVIFMAHGESTLDFVLRYWTSVDYYYSTSTDIRFDIDRSFREQGVEIAFPQRDVHIRTVVGQALSKQGAGPPVEGEGGG